MSISDLAGCCTAGARRERFLLLLQTTYDRSSPLERQHPDGSNLLGGSEALGIWEVV